MFLAGSDCATAGSDEYKRLDKKKKKMSFHCVEGESQVSSLAFSSVQSVKGNSSLGPAGFVSRGLDPGVFPFPSNISHPCES